MASTTPEGLQIRPRHLDFDLPSPLPRHWHSGDAFKTHLFDVMSVLFPDGERFFIDSVRQFRDQIDDPVLKEQIRGFIGQEGHHSREHLVYSQRLRDLGYQVERMERRAQARIRYTQKKLSPRRQLAATAALEHITAIMADAVLKNPEPLHGAHPAMARLWRWHALEVWRDGLKWAWGKDGVFRPLVRTYLDFFKADFHPWQHNNLDLLDRFRGEFEPQAKAA